MSDLVREFFPDAPQRCLNCPGLLAAAERLQSDFGLATAFAAGEDNPANPINDPPEADKRRSELAGALSQAFTQKAVSNQQMTSILGRDLWEQCPLGPLTAELPQARRKKPLQAVDCGSESSIKQFIPTVQREL